MNCKIKPRKLKQKTISNRERVKSDEYFVIVNCSWWRLCVETIRVGLVCTSTRRRTQTQTHLVNIGSTTARPVFADGRMENQIPMTRTVSEWRNQVANLMTKTVQANTASYAKELQVSSVYRLWIYLWKIWRRRKSVPSWYSMSDAHTNKAYQQNSLLAEMLLMLPTHC